MPALADACKAQDDGKTTILEMMVTRELGDPFRCDALSMPVGTRRNIRNTSDRTGGNASLYPRLQ
jgi:hypothetical protein